MTSHTIVFIITVSLLFVLSLFILLLLVVVVVVTFVALLLLLVVLVLHTLADSAAVGADGRGKRRAQTCNIG